MSNKRRRGGQKHDDNEDDDVDASPPAEAATRNEWQIPSAVSQTKRRATPAAKTKRGKDLELMMDIMVTLVERMS